MKRLVVILIALFIVGAVNHSQAQLANNSTKKEVKKEQKAEKKALRKLKGAYVSDASKRSFFTDFGNVPNVVWTRTDYFDEAVFMKNGKELKAYYDEDGNLVGTTSVITFEEIPAIAQQKIKKNYKDAVPGKVIFYDDNEINDTDMLLYGIPFDTPDIYFVEMTQGDKKFVVNCDTKGNVSFFKQL